MKWDGSNSERDDVSCPRGALTRCQGHANRKWLDTGSSKSCLNCCASRASRASCRFSHSIHHPPQASKHGRNIVKLYCVQRPVHASGPFLEAACVGRWSAVVFIHSLFLMRYDTTKYILSFSLYICTAATYSASLWSIIPTSYTSCALLNYCRTRSGVPLCHSLHHLPTLQPGR